MVQQSLSPKSLSVLDSIKNEKGLRSREEAFELLVKSTEPELLAYEVKAEYLEEIQNILQEHKEKYGRFGGKITLEEVDKLLEEGE